MHDLPSARWMYLKAFLLLSIGLVAGGLLLSNLPTLKTAALLIVAVWAFCRAYYFAFYVIQHWLDPGYRYSGLLAFARYLLGRRRT